MIKRGNSKNTSARLTAPQREQKQPSLFTKTQTIIDTNTALEIINETTIVLSDAEDWKNVVVIPSQKSIYTEETIEKEFDTKLWQLLTPAEPKSIDSDPSIPEPEPEPPFTKPTKLFIRARNYRWVIADGVQVEDGWDGTRPWRPAGIETKGALANPLGNVTLLYAPGDHALFYPREVENFVNAEKQSTRQGLTWEWKLDGNIVSTLMYATINNLRSQGEKWKDVSSPHNIVCKISNEHGSIEQDFNFIVAENVRWDGTDNYKEHHSGWYQFHEEQYWNHGTDPVSFIDDPKYAPRVITINDIEFSGYDSNNARPSKFKLDKGDGNFILEAQYKIDNGGWIKASNFFKNESNKTRAFRFRGMSGYNSGERISWSAPGGGQTTIKFRYTYKYYDGVWPWRKKYHREYSATKTIDVPTDVNKQIVTVSKWNIGYKNVRK